MQGFWTVLFLALAALIAYTVGGYPLLLGWLASRYGKPVHKAWAPKRVSLILPVFNGARFLGDKLDSVLALNYPRELLEIIVVSDGSTDGTDDIARSYEDRGVRLLRVPRGGKPAALNAGLGASTGEILLLTDARQVLHPDSLRHMAACFADPQVGVVSGDLLIREGSVEEASVGLYWRYERRIRKLLGRLDSTLGATGPFYAIRRELAVPVPPDTLLDDVYLPLAAFFRGFRLVVEEEALAFDYPTSVKTEFGRKVRTLAGNYQLMWQCPMLLSARNRMLFHYLSYKAARLALPWMVVVLGAASFGLPPGWRAAVLASQAVFYGLAALDFLVPERSPIRRLTAPFRTAVSLLAATACAVVVFFVPPRRLWKPTEIEAVRE